MANSFTEYTGDGSTTAYTITFDYLATADVKAFLNGTATTAFSVNGQTLTFNSAPASQTAILIERDTPKASRLVDFSDGAILSEADLDKNANQLFFISQEAVDTADRAMSLNSANQFDATVSSTARRIVNMADPVDAQDAVTKNWLTTTYLTPANITNIDTTGTNIASINTVAGAIANVNSVAGNATNINTVAGNNANINTVAGNNTNISTVAGISSQVTTVANASSNIAAVAADIAAVQTVASDLGEAISEIETVAADLQEAVPEIDTVAGAIANVNTVGTNINNVNATGGAITNVNTVAGQISPTNNLGTVAGISTEIGNVAGISSAVSSVGSNIANVNNVAGQISPTNNISTVASNISDIQDVGGNIGAITTVNGISANVSTVAGISSDVTSVAGNSTNITNVANNASNITTVAGAATNINTVAANVTNVGAVANISSDVTTVAGDATDIGTVAGAIANVNSVASNSSNINAVAGNSTNINSVAGNASNINTVAGISANVSTVASNVAGVNSFADRYRVGSSDPSSSNDAGDLFFNTSASVLKFYNGTSWNQLATPAAPAIEDNSGTPVLATGITAAEVRTAIGAGTSSFDGSYSSLTGAPNFLRSDADDTATGDITFQGFVTVAGATGYPVLHIKPASAGNTARIRMGLATDDDHGQISYNNSSGEMTLRSDNVDTMTLNGSNVLIGTDSGDAFDGGSSLRLQKASGSNYIQIKGGTSSNVGLLLGDTADDFVGGLIYVNTDNRLEFFANNAERMRLENDGDLHVDGNVTAYSTTISDIRLKKDIAPIEDAVTKVQQLNGCTFTYLKDDRKSAGLIAQDVEKVLPSAVIEDEAVFHGEEGETYKTVQYDQVIGLLVEAVKDLKAEIEELKNGPSQ